MRVAAPLLAVVLSGISFPALADCTCRAPGITAQHGQTVCLRTPSGLRLARCGMVLNNSSWTFLPDPCPEASRQSVPTVAVAMSVAPAASLTP